MKMIINDIIVVADYVLWLDCISGSLVIEISFQKRYLWYCTKVHELSFHKCIAGFISLVASTPSGFPADAYIRLLQSVDKERTYTKLWLDVENHGVAKRNLETDTICDVALFRRYDHRPSFSATDPMSSMICTTPDLCSTKVCSQLISVWPCKSRCSEARTSHYASSTAHRVPSLQ